MSIAARLDGLEQRVRALSDCAAIEALKARYWHALDLKRPDVVRDCLAEDLVVEFEGLPRFESRDAFMAIIRQGAARTQAFDMHHGQNPRITLTGADSAEGEWDVFYYGIDLSTRTLMQMAGAYRDTYVRRDGRWWIATMAMWQTSLHVQSVDQAGSARTSIFGRAAAPISFQTQEGSA
jgi:SnoaL-like domain